MSLGDAYIGSGPLRFVERVDAPVMWSTLAGLKGMSIGVVDGYINTADFDANVAAGEIKGEAVSDDLTNIKKVAAGRVPLAVIDFNVFNHLLGSDPSLETAKGKVQLNAKILENKSLHIAFHRTAGGEEAARVINEGLKKIDAAAISAKFFD